MARQYFGFRTDEHSVVVETSPNQTTREKLQLLKQEGVSRLSIGVQSFVEDELAALHRFHDVDTARQALEAIREMDFTCMNVDLIYGIPGQTMDSLLYSLMQVLEYEPEEIFIYPLYVKPGTYLYQQGAERGEETFRMYHMVQEVLGEAGYQPHSMRRFVKVNDNRISNKNEAVDKWKAKNHDEERRKTLKYLPESLCGFGNTISIGCGGRSYIGNLHFCTPYAVRQKDCIASIKEYIGRTDYLQVPHGFLLSEDEQKRRYVIKHILFGKGIDCKDYSKHFQGEMLDSFPQIKEWEQAGYVAIEKDYITFTEEGFALSDYLGPQLISENVRKKTEEYYKEFM